MDLDIEPIGADVLINAMLNLTNMDLDIFCS